MTFMDRDGNPAVYCDACRQLVDQAVEPGRWRHRNCPPPPLPAAALEVLAHVHRNDR